MAAKIKVPSDFAAVNAEAAQQIALVSSAFNDLMRFHPGAVREGLAVLRLCEERLKKIAQREQARQVKAGEPH